MGISGLLPALASITRKTNIQEFSGKRVAVDAYVWLHRCAVSCSFELCTNTPTDKYLVGCMRMVKLLQQLNIKPILVFDGNSLPLKKDEEARRRERREERKRLALELLRQGKRAEAEKQFQAAVDITPVMAFNLIQLLKREGVDFIVAPYEADAQLAFLALNNIVDVVLTEDSDLIPYGAPRILFKWDSKTGVCDAIDLADLGKAKEMQLANFTMDMLRYTCILSGCDYLEGVDGLGVKTSHQLVRQFKGDINRVISYLRLEKLKNLPEDYEARFRKAELTFRHQRVYDPRTKKLTFLNPLPEGLDASELDFLGEDLPDDIAHGIATGVLNPHTKKPFISIPTSPSSPKLNATVSMVSPMKDVQKYEQRPARSAGHGLSVKLTQSTAITRFFKPVTNNGTELSTAATSDSSETQSFSGNSGSGGSSSSPAGSLSDSDCIVLDDGTIEYIEGTCTPPTSQPKILAKDTPSPLKKSQHRLSNCGNDTFNENSQTTTSAPPKRVIISRFFASPELLSQQPATTDSALQGKQDQHSSVTPPSSQLSSTREPASQNPPLSRANSTNSITNTTNRRVIVNLYGEEEMSITPPTILESLFTADLSEKTKLVQSWRQSSQTQTAHQSVLTTKSETFITSTSISSPPSKKDEPKLLGDDDDDFDTLFDSDSENPVVVAPAEPPKTSKPSTLSLVRQLSGNAALGNKRMSLRPVPPPPCQVIVLSDDDNDNDENGSDLDSSQPTPKKATDVDLSMFAFNQTSNGAPKRKDYAGKNDSTQTKRRKL